MARRFLCFYSFLVIVLSYACAIPANSRILGGENASIGQFPHQISLQYEDGFHNCGGSILNEHFIITAAHCVVVGDGIEAYPVKFFQIRVGSVQRSMGGELRKIKRIIVNKNYNNTNFQNDIALIELEQPLKWTNNIMPIEMATEEVPRGAEVVISGWGRLYGNGPFPNHLQWNTVKAITYEECTKAMRYADKSIICLVHEPQNGACFGDSGGPATYKGKLVGVSSFVVGRDYPDCGTEYPDGYAKVSHHRDWILENMKLLDFM